MVPTVIPLRTNRRPRVHTRIFELPTGHPLLDQLCPACDDNLNHEEPTVLVLVGPGTDQDDLDKARDGGWHSGLGVPVHLSCTGWTRAQVEGGDALA
jgi:hypothetical protein